MGAFLIFLTAIFLSISNIDCLNCASSTTVGVCSSLSQGGRTVFLSGVIPADDTSNCVCSAKLTGLTVGTSEQLTITNTTDTSGSCDQYVELSAPLNRSATFSTCVSSMVSYNINNEERINIKLVKTSTVQPPLTFCLQLYTSEPGIEVILECKTSTGPIQSSSSSSSSSSTSSTGTSAGGLTSATGTAAGGSTSATGTSAGGSSINNGGSVTSSSPSGGNSGSNSQTTTSPSNPKPTNPAPSTDETSNLGLILGVTFLLLIIIVIIVIILCVNNKKKKKKNKVGIS